MTAKNRSQIITKKLDKNNFPTWKFRMKNFLMQKGYWEYIEGDLEETPKIPKKTQLLHKSRHLKIGIMKQEKCCIDYHLASQIRWLDIYKILYSQRKLGTIW